MEEDVAIDDIADVFTDTVIGIKKLVAV